MDDASDNQDIDKIASDIVSQLKNTVATASTSSELTTNLSKDDLDKYIVDKTSTLVDQTLFVVNSLKDYVSVGGADSKEIMAFAEVVKATSSALEALNKIHISNQKTDNSIKLKQMDIEARKNIAQQDNATRLLLSREELMKELLNRSQEEKTIEAEVVE